MTTVGLRTTEAVRGAPPPALAASAGPHLVPHPSRESKSEKYAARSSLAAGEEQKKRTLPHGRKREELRYLFSPSRLLRCSFLPCSV
jgi:hypothetical protein